MDCSYHSGLPPQTRNDQQSFHSNRDGLKPHSTHTTFKWLDKNYQLEDGVCLPRCTIYEHYQSYCDAQRLQPVNAASFGKIVRQHFPSLTTRRLGTRGQSKYHYYGLGIKPTSEYYPSDYIDRVKQGGNQKKTAEPKKTAAHDKPSTVLPVFPDVANLLLSDSIPVDKLKTFMVMYRAHCQRILDSVVRANFNEVENFLLHFWQGMPSHMLPVLGSEVVIDLVAYCDTLLYQVICNVLITSPLQNLPESLAGEYRWFADMLRQWMEVALKGLPESLQEAKYKVAEGFINGLRRQTSLTKLAQVAQSELRNSNSLNQLRQDWECVDFQSVYAQTLYSIQPMKIPPKYSNLLPHFLQRFNDLLHEETGLEHFLSFAEQMVHDAIGKGIDGDLLPLKEACQAFLLSWKFFNTKILEEFTMENAPSFGFFILLHMFLDDYVAHLLETKLEKEEEKVYYRRIHMLKKKDTELSGPTLHQTNSSSNSSSPLQSADEDMTDNTFDTAPATTTLGREGGITASIMRVGSSMKEHNTKDHSEVFPGNAGPLNNLFSNLSNTFHNSESPLGTLAGIGGVAGGVSLSNKINPFYSSLATSSHSLHPPFGSSGSVNSGSGPISAVGGSSGQLHQKLATPNDFVSLDTFGGNISLQTKMGDVSTSSTSTRSSTIYNQQTTSSLIQSANVGGRHQSLSINVGGRLPTDPPTGGAPGSYPPSSQTALYPTVVSSEQSPPVVPSQLHSNIKPHSQLSNNTSFNIFSLSSSNPAPTQSPQAPPPQRPSCSVPMSSPSFTTQRQGVFQGGVTPPPTAAPPTQHVTMTTPGRVADTQSNRSLSSLTSFPTLNVPYSHHPSTTTPTLSAGTNSLSLFPTVQGMYPYTQFVGIPTHPFNPAGLPMPGATATPNQMTSGYPYLTPQSLYNPQQLATTSYSRQ